MKKIKIFSAFLLFMTFQIYAECPYDHLIIGINQDGLYGTDDDDKLFVDCSQKYRRTPTSFECWYYPLNKSWYSNYKWRISEPGFDQFQGTNDSAAYTYDPNRCPVGSVNQDYDIIIECIAISSGLRAVPQDSYWPTIYNAGESLDYGALCAYRDNTHTHVSFQAVDGTNLFWATFQMYDALGKYEDSEPFTIVFNTAPVAGDLVIDGVVNFDDVAELAYYWLGDEGARENDYYERADANRNGYVDFQDFVLMAENWQQQY